MLKYRQLSIAKRSRTGIRIEAPGCVVYVEPCGNGGATRVDIVSDGQRWGEDARISAEPADNGQTMRVIVTTAKARQ